MVKFERKDVYDLEDLRRIVHLLRHEGGCSWDMAQTHASLRRCMLEEAYEVCEAIDLDDAALLREELGDVLLQVVFHADLAADEGRFNLDGVADGVAQKMVRRHPHVFSGSPGAPADWDEIKRQEKAQTSQTQTLRSVARSLPALIRAEKLQKRAGCPVPAVPAQPKSPEEAIGDQLFMLVAQAREAGVDAEEALHGACARFIERFAAAEQEITKRGEDQP